MEHICFEVQLCIQISIFIEFCFQKSIQYPTKIHENQYRNIVQDGVYLGSDFSSISVDFWEQIRKENATETDTTTHR